MKSMKQVIDELRKSGYQIRAYKRKDGGYLIREINGAKFTGAQGNAAARQIANAPLSQRKKMQLKSITPTTKETKLARRKGTAKTPLPQDIISEIRKVQRLMRKSLKSDLGTYTTIRTEAIRKKFFEESPEAAKQALAKAKAYAQGFAYVSNVEILADRIKETAKHYKGSSHGHLISIARAIELKKTNFLEDWINTIYEKLYDFTKSNPPSSDPSDASKKFRDEVFSIIGH